MRRVIFSLLEKECFDIVHFDHLHMSQYSNLVKDTRKILDEHNVENMIWRRYYETEGNFFKKMFIYIQWKKVRKYESKICNDFNICLVVSAKEGKILRELCPNVDIRVISNGVDTDYFVPSHNQVEPHNIIFVGSMDWLPNIDAVMYFANEILPSIQREIPDIQLYIVGHNPPSQIKFLSLNRNITVTGSVEDVRLYIARSSICIAPLRIGGGTRLKILEGMAMRKAIVSTSVGCEGIEITPNENIVVADNPEDFARCVVKLLKDDRLCEKLGGNGHKLVQEKYSWRTISITLEQIYENLLNKAIE